MTGLKSMIGGYAGWMRRYKGEIMMVTDKGSAKYPYDDGKYYAS
ncbi:hypothetical protein T4B_3591 [Trichinella pseudospiralis]|uniref:Uncharacterized protein n=1 Tax=Trichinella pseudospiralis TaxID=6337 RepID=A0A0V1GLG5_TRIPS|nr:hypothetical protein T4B_3591 [Trichinella pseudospiralis]